jgi:hypothetical protein
VGGRLRLSFYLWRMRLRAQLVVRQDLQQRIRQQGRNLRVQLLSGEAKRLDRCAGVGAGAAQVCRHAARSGRCQFEGIPHTRLPRHMGPAVMHNSAQLLEGGYHFSDVALLSQVLRPLVGAQLGHARGLVGAVNVAAEVGGAPRLMQNGGG